MGVFSNARNIAKIKGNLCTLHQQNQLQLLTWTSSFKRNQKISTVH